MGLSTVECPVCERTIRVGIPRSADLAGVATEREALPGGSELKVRAIECDGGHRFFFGFDPGFDDGADGDL